MRRIRSSCQILGCSKARSSLSAVEFFAHRFHLGEGVLVVGAIGYGDASVQALEGFVDAVERDEGLRGHLVGRDVVGIVRDAVGELGEGRIGLALGDTFHGQAVASEGVCGVELKNFVERG